MKAKLHFKTTDEPIDIEANTFAGLFRLFTKILRDQGLHEEDLTLVVMDYKTKKEMSLWNVGA
jgi:hypothetical protein